jgi:hypothetical protein
MHGSYLLPYQIPPPPHSIMTIWTIYKSPFAFANEYVLHLQYIVKWSNQPLLTPFRWQGRTVSELRALLPDGVVKLENHPRNNPLVMEMWV